MPAIRIDLEEPQHSDDVLYLPRRPAGVFERRRSLSSCTIGNDVPSNDLDVEEVVDLTVDTSTSGHRLLEQGEFALEKIRLLNSAVEKGSFIQVHEFFSGNYLAEFVLVKLVVRCQVTNTIKIRGTPFARNCSTLAKLPKKPNEVCMLIHRDDDTKHEELVDINPSDVIQLFPLIITNATYPKFNRAVFNPRYPEERGRPNRQEILRNRWRGTTVKGGSWTPARNSDFIDLESAGVNDEYRSCGQQYTMFDSCSGAGGVSRGALMAGFKIQYAIDKAPEVWPTYQTNFPGTELFRMSLDQFLSSPRTTHMRVDVLHFSPPCQFFSPAHTHVSVHDDDNIFALYGCNELLKKLRPRIITVEQTFGLTHGRHKEYFNAFLGDFTQHGYSVRWRVIKLCTWGAAQDRKRLIIIAAAPGESLPPFPRATHSQEGGNGLLPYNSIGKALRVVRPGDDLHNLDLVHYFRPRRAPYDPERLAGTITTGGGDFYYPDGSRKLTLREFASLQGFPKSHRFLGNTTSIKRQIGNAFPPNTVRVLYKHIENWLLREDGMMPWTNDHNVILVEDDSDSTTNLTDDSMIDGNMIFDLT
ncbi:hypothetical protein F53441_13786 [Fusarium austroafricanum]|uniref:DNA (cytosine-5-)-methyltransferase n=1 Tax=Fusarium austroafricanum TaxID=2364996 RepID=A0A8H4NIA8_9HYPO|nr:hypothetical protein F53441_13786 [Fusarium austroafricanum]